MTGIEYAKVSTIQVASKNLSQRIALNERGTLCLSSRPSADHKDLQPSPASMFMRRTKTQDAILTSCSDCGSIFSYRPMSLVSAICMLSSFFLLGSLIGHPSQRHLDERLPTSDNIRANVLVEQVDQLGESPVFVHSTVRGAQKILPPIPESSFRKRGLEIQPTDWDTLTDKELAAHIQTTVTNGNNVQKATVEGVEFLWQMPLNTQTRPKAIMFLAHASGRVAADWFTSLTGPHSPEEKAIVKEIRQRGMMVVAMDALNRNNKQWDHHDASRIARVFRQLQGRQAPLFDSFTSQNRKGYFPDFVYAAARPAPRVPLLAFGSSTAPKVLNYYVPPILRKHYKTATGLDGMIVQNTGPLNQIKKIPTVYITLSGEGKKSEEIDLALDEEDNGHIAKHIRIPKELFRADKISKRIDYISSDQSGLIYYDLLSKQDMMEKESTGDASFPSSSKYDSAVQEILEKFSSSLTESSKNSRSDKAKLTRDITDVLMIASGRLGEQTVTRDGLTEALDWLDPFLAQASLGVSTKSASQEPMV